MPQMLLVTKLRSYSRICTKSDYKLVMTKTLFKWKYSNTPSYRFCINYKFFCGKDKRKQYKVETEQQLQKRPFSRIKEQRWTNTVTVTTTAAENTAKT